MTSLGTTKQMLFLLNSKFEEKTNTLSDDIYYEILQEAMEEGLRMNGWRARLLDEGKIWSKKWMNERMNVTID